MCDLVARHLSGIGYQVLIATSPQEAQRVVQFHAASNIDLLLTDLEMPEMRGDELAGWFAIECPKARVICMSSRPQSLPNCVGVAFIEKPFLLSSLDHEVRIALGEDSSSRIHEDAVAARVSSQATYVACTSRERPGMGKKRGDELAGRFEAY
jgi:CheY-like chemotaxis protein